MERGRIMTLVVKEGDECIREKLEHKLRKMGPSGARGVRKREMT